MYTDTLENTRTIVTRKAEQHQGECIMTGDIRVRSPSARAAGTAHEKQRNPQHSKDAMAYRLLGHTKQVCPTFIRTRHSGETSLEDSLHKAFVAFPSFKGKDINNLAQLFRDNMHDLYDRFFDIDAEAINVPEDFYTTLSDAIKAARDSHNAELDT